jgi:hypothetical protein
MKTDYNFTVRRLQIPDGHRPQSFFDRDIAGFVHEFGHEGWLNIVYYAGHGKFDAVQRDFGLYRYITVNALRQTLLTLINLLGGRTRSMSS